MCLTNVEQEHAAEYDKFDAFKEAIKQRFQASEL